MSSIAVGTKVGARRWPFACGHVDGWQKPWSGVVLAADDPRAWAGSVAFPSARPNKAKVVEHVAYLQSQGMCTRVPVLWTFGTVKKIFWEAADSLRTYADDLA